MITDRRVALRRLGLRLKRGAWQFHGKPQVADDQVDVVAEPDWQALVQRWRRNRVR
jgi:hypothetical protein